MTRKLIKLIILMIILMICSLLIQLYFVSSDIIECMSNEYQTSNEFNTLVSNKNVVTKITDIDGENLLKTYNSMTLDDAKNKHINDTQDLYIDIVKKEEFAINERLTSKPDIKIIYLTESPPDDMDSNNIAGEFIRQINGKWFVWQPFFKDMFVTSEEELKTRMNNDNNKSPYLEVWLLEEARSGNYQNLSEEVGGVYNRRRPNTTSVYNYIKDNDNQSRVNDTNVENVNYFIDDDGIEKLKVGDKNVIFHGHRRDGVGRHLGRRRIFDRPHKMERIESGNGRFNRGNYAKNKDTREYKQYILDSVNHMNDNANNPECFGLQWKSGELFWSEGTECDNIINKMPQYHRGWPTSWALDVYSIEDNSVGGGVIFDFAKPVEMDSSEAERRRKNIIRNNKSILIIKKDLQ